MPWWGFGRDDGLVRFLEGVPVVGLGVAAVQAAAGNPEHAKRALAVSLGNTVKAAGAAAGFVVGGPVGAVAGGAAAASVGIGTEWAISTTINDPNVKGDVGEVSWKRVGVDTVLCGATGVFGGGGASAVQGQVTQAVKSGLQQTAKQMAKEAMMSTGEQVAVQFGASAGKTAVAQVGTQALMEGGSKLLKKSPSAVLKPAKGDNKPFKPVFTAEQDAAARALEQVINAQKQFIDGSPHKAFLTQTVTNVDQHGALNTDGVYAAIGQVLNGTLNIVDGVDWEPWIEAWEHQEALLLWNLQNKLPQILLQQMQQLGLAGHVLQPIQVPFVHGSGQAEAYDQVKMAVETAVANLDAALATGPRLVVAN